MCTGTYAVPSGFIEQKNSEKENIELKIQKNLITWLKSKDEEVKLCILNGETIIANCMVHK